MIFNTSFSNITVLKISVPIPTRTGGALTYNGNAQTPTWNYDSTLVQLVSGGSGTNAGIYGAVFRLLDPEKYMWEDKGKYDKTVEWEIERATISAIPSQSGTLTYTGNVQSPTWANYDANKMTVAGDTSAIDAKTYTIEFTPTMNYKWSDGSIGAKQVQWTIGKKPISMVPSQSGTLTYNGNLLTPTWNNYNPLELDISGDTSGTNAGDYTAVFTPNKNCKWADSVDLADLPNGYTQVDYIENPNGAYINNIGVSSVYQGTDIELKVKILDTAAIYHAQLRVYQNGNFTANNSNKLGVANIDGSYSVSLQSITSSLTQAEQKPTTIQLGSENEVTLSIKGGGVSTNDIVLTANGKSATRAKCPTPGMTPLFAYHDKLNYVNNDTASYDKISSTYNFRLYYIKTVDNGKNSSYRGDTRNFVPCIAPDGKVGLYETVTKTFYGSSNDENFTAGPISVASENVSPVTVTWSIARLNITVAPSQDGNLVYTGSVISPVWKNYDPNTLDIGGEVSGINAKSYDATFTPNSNCQWWDGTTTSKTVTWVISKADVTISVNPTRLSLDLDNKVGEITVTRNSTGEITAESSDTTVVTVEVDGTTVKVTGVYTGDINITVSVASDENYNEGSIQVPVSSTVPRMYTVTADIEPSGYGTVDGLGTYPEGTEVTITANPGTDYKFVGWQSTKSRLPAGYTELEYIEVNNRTRIQTGYTVTNPLNTRIVMDLMPLEKVSLYRYLFSALNTSPISTMPAIMLRQDNASNRMFWFAGFNAVENTSQKGTFTYNMAANTRITAEMDLASKKVKMGSSSFTITPLSTMNNANCGKLFIGTTSVAADDSNDYSLHMNVYSFQVYVADALVCDMVPCKDAEGVAGVYDLVTDSFHSSYLADATAGPEIAPEIEIVSTSSEYKFTLLGNVHFTAVFKEIVPEYTINASVNPDGSGVVTGAGVYEENTEVSLEATANEGYQFLDWSEKEESRLPNGYTELEYIQSTGTQYIDTGFIPNNNIRVTSKFKYISASGTFFSVFGVEGSDGYNGYQLFGRNGQTGVQGIYGDEYYGLSNGTYSTTTPNEIDINGNQITFDGNTQSLQSQTFTCDTTLYLFCSHKYQSASSTTPQQNCSMELYSFKIYDNGELVRDFVPCKDPSDAIGLYDLVNERFYANAGIGDFVAGPENATEYQLSTENPYVFEAVRDIDLVANFEEKKSRLPAGYTEVEYIESSGSQYIDTNVSNFYGLNISGVFEALELPTSSSSFFMASYKAGTSIFYFLGFGYKNDDITCYYARYKEVIGTLIPFKKSTYQIFMDTKEFWVDENKIVTNESTRTSYNTMFLFATHNAYSNSAAEFASARLYSFDITKAADGSYVRQFVPCISPDNKVGLYDLAESKFYPNAGTGTFVAGPKV